MKTKKFTLLERRRFGRATPNLRDLLSSPTAVHTKFPEVSVPAFEEMMREKEPQNDYERLQARINKETAERGYSKKIKGIFGDGDYGFGGLVEWERDGKTKIYGVSYLYDGIINHQVTEALAPFKRLLLDSLVFPPLGLYVLWRIPNWKDLIVLFWKNDNAYRQRGQDLFGELDKEKLKENTRKEILRVLNIGYSRERNMFPYSSIYDRKFGSLIYRIRLFGRGRDMGNKWRTLIKVASVALLFPTISRLVRDFLLRLDLDKLSLDEASFYWCCRREGYDFRGMTLEERMNWAELKDYELKHIIINV